MKYHAHFLYLIGLVLLLLLNGGCKTKSQSSPPAENRGIGHDLGPGPLRFPQVSIRTEKYLLPAVTTGPLDPDWSPDSRWISFSMRGDIWKVPAKGGEAIAMTQGPDYYFEPAWSPDGNAMAFTTDHDGRLAIGVMDTDGKNKRLIVTDSDINIEPAWSVDGKSIYFVSDRGKGLSIYKVTLSSGTISPVVEENGNQIQPAVSPDGHAIAYISRVRAKPGSGGIWVKDLSSGQSTMIHYEETRDRAAPVWTPDGASIVYVSEVTGNNDIGIIPADGGARVWLTHASMNEMAPAVSSDGQLAFVSGRKGPTTLFTLPLSGGTSSSWNKVTLTSQKAGRPEGKIRLNIEGEGGNKMAARIYLKASDGRSYAPSNGFQRVNSVGEQYYFHTDGSDVIRLPAGTTHIEAVKGYEYMPAKRDVKVPANGEVEVSLQPKRFVNPNERGWYSGDTHVHDLHGGRYGLSHTDFFKQLEAEDINVTNALIHMDGTRIMGRWKDLSGKPSPLSTKNHILQYAEEFRGSRGHMILLGIHKFILPFVAGEQGTPYSSEKLNFKYIDKAVAQGGIAGFPHPYWAPVDKPADGAFSEIPLDVALGKGSFYDVLCIPYDAFDNAEMYYHLLNSGFQLAATGGSDPFPDVWRDPPPGTDRAYAFIDGSLSVSSWLDAVKAGHTFASNGPLLFMKVDDKIPGSEINLQGENPDTLNVHGEVASIAPLSKLDILLNGEVVKSLDVSNKGNRFDFSASVEVETNGWIAVRAYGRQNKYVTDSYPFAQTTPVYILRNGKRFTSPEDARFLHDVVEAEWKSVKKRDLWHSGKGREQYREAVQKAEAVYRKIAKGTYTFEK